MKVFLNLTNGCQRCVDNGIATVVETCGGVGKEFCLDDLGANFDTYAGAAVCSSTASTKFGGPAATLCGPPIATSDFLCTQTGIFPDPSNCRK